MSADLRRSPRQRWVAIAFPHSLGRSRFPSTRDAQPRAQVLRDLDWQAPTDRDRTFALPAIELGSTQ